MVPSNKWFPTNLLERASWFANFTANITVIGASVGLTPADITSIGHDNDMMQFLASGDSAISAYVDAIRSFRKVVTEGNIGDPTPTFPDDPTLTPAAAVPTGMFERLDDVVKRIKAAPSYSDEVGALLGILTSGGGSKVPVGDVPPVLKASVDPGHVIELKFVRGNSDGIYIEKNVNSAGWTFAEKAFKSPAVFAVPGDGIPQGVQLRARYIEGNNPVGDWSDIVTVQTIP